MPNQNKSRRGRNVGTGIAKMSRSRWKSYANLVESQKKRRTKTTERRFCFECETQFHSRGAIKRHRC